MRTGEANLVVVIRDTDAFLVDGLQIPDGYDCVLYGCVVLGDEVLDFRGRLT